MNYFNELIEELSKGKDKKLIEYTKANIIRTFCPHMFFQDLEKMQCRDIKGRMKAGYSCEKCWGCKIIEEKPKKERKNKNEKDKPSKKSSKTNRNKNLRTRIKKNKNTRH